MFAKGVETDGARVEGIDPTVKCTRQEILAPQEIGEDLFGALRTRSLIVSR